ncbi:YolD-like family protein [Marinococcus halophilus]|uniref:YolD-like family protein n=1 Tax=Marinococcus halophilus TaxID=1371 RepID=A0A510Y697_MARHA|nr:YolD-like family protein [Marinococcus halophilus]OZT80544.1 YolD-like family protein [Marinococcus halophilus]GEK58896.1 hypothetical protein MHA01_18010 [Marinococcus halophilus]
MKENKLTPGSNMRWESSRMILPEHREMWLRHQKEDRMKFRPVWDEQQLEEFSRRLQDALVSGSTVTLHVFDPYAEIKMRGKILHLDALNKTIKMKAGGGIQYVGVQDIMDVET